MDAKPPSKALKCSQTLEEVGALKAAYARFPVNSKHDLEDHQNRRDPFVKTLKSTLKLTL
jgi:hypothetical protein